MRAAIRRLCIIRMYYSYDRMSVPGVSGVARPTVRGRGLLGRAEGNVLTCCSQPELDMVIDI